LSEFVKVLEIISVYELHLWVLPLGFFLFG